jgi:hypothetical protein
VLGYLRLLYYLNSIYPHIFSFYYFIDNFIKNKVGKSPGVGRSKRIINPLLLSIYSRVILVAMGGLEPPTPAL